MVQALGFAAGHWLVIEITWGRIQRCARVINNPAPDQGWCTPSDGFSSSREAVQLNMALFLWLLRPFKDANELILGRLVPLDERICGTS